MPSFAARFAAFVLRTTGVYRKLYSGGPDFHKHQAKALSVPSEPSAKWQARLSVTRREFRGRPVWDIAPKDRTPDLTMLYWHGGGYVYPATSGHWDFAAHMADAHGLRMIMPLYPLAPMAEVGEITDFALDFYKDLIGRPDTGRFVMGGDSAGGGLAAATAIAARDAGLPMPERLVLICPWLDASPSHPDQPTIERRDSILTIRGIQEAGEMYAGAAGVRDPRVSPIHADWSGLPPILAFGGSDDILVVDARALEAKVPSLNYVEGSGLMHDWPIFSFPESRKAQAQMAAFASG
ncbi:MAG: alpha/beta hydrolase [Sphingomonadaceae bacterium]